ncbi:MAG TPA: DedA family protein [Nocardioidaceae bacterium]|nr:DedA family protein [Nocardioidaceae bacterium]
MLSSSDSTVLASSVLPGWLDPETLLNQAGNWAMWVAIAIIFAECAVLLGFFLPGDTLLFSLGIFVSQGIVDEPIWLVCLLLVTAAIAGNMVGYEIGYRVGPPLLERPNRRLLHPEHIRRTHEFFEKYGAPAIILARFVPIVRTLITVTAGVAEMDRRRYFVYSAIGALFWASGVTAAGYALGNVEFVRSHVQPHLDLLLVGAVLIGVLPVGIHLLRERRRIKRERRESPTAP